MSAPAAFVSAPARPAPPPREVTAAALVRGLASAQRLIGPASLLLALALVIEVAAHTGEVAALVALVLWWLPAFVVSVALMLRPTPAMAITTIVVGVLAGTGYVATILQAYSDEQSRGLFLVESLAWALLLIGAIRPNALDGVLWVFTGLVAGTVAIVSGYLIAGHEIVLSPDRLTDASIMMAAYLVIAIGGRRRRDRLPELPDAALVSHRQNAARQRERAATALVHDTVLASLTLVERSSDALDERVRAGIRRDIAAVAQASATSVGVVSAAPIEGSLAARLLGVVNDLRWRGLRIDVSGTESLASELSLSEAEQEALLAATVAALDNVLRHAATDRAEVVVGSTDRAVTVMIIDAGQGFDIDEVPANRLGLRESIHGRLARVGGLARVWSTDDGVTVMLTVPLTPWASAT